jgi:hypothetical protein
MELIYEKTRGKKSRATLPLSFLPSSLFYKQKPVIIKNVLSEQ